MDPRAGYAELLHAPADATAETATAAFLRALPGASFVPPAERVAAANALAGTSAPTGRGADVEQLLRDELDAFAAKFWGLTPAARQTIWADLSRRGADAARLRELEPALDVSSPALADPVAEELAALVRALVVLPPRARAIRRNTWLLERAAEVEKWRAALAAVRRDAPALAVLEPHLRAALDPGFDLALAAYVDGAAAQPTDRSVAADVADFIARKRNSENGYELDYDAANRDGVKGILWGVVLGLGFMVFFSVSIGLSNRPSKESAIDKSPAGAAPVPVPQRFTYPAPVYVSPGGSAPTVPNFTLAEVAEFERYEQEKKTDNVPKQPPAYVMWRLAGRPAGVSGTQRPAAERSSYSFSRAQIEICEDYDEGITRSKPALYDRWVAAGKPTVPGAYPLINQNP